MPGIIVKDGKTHFANIKFVATAPQNYWLLLIQEGTINKDDVVDDDIQLGSGLTEVTGTGYARVELIRGNWIITDQTIGGKVRVVASYAQQTFTIGAGGWANVKGYALAESESGNDVIAAESFPVGQQGSKTIGKVVKITPIMIEEREDE